MKVSVHLPRESEASLHQPSLKGDITITPRVYKRIGLVTIAHLTVATEHAVERYSLMVSTANGQLRIEKLVEVVPACDEPLKVKDAHRSTGDAASKD